MKAVPAMKKLAEITAIITCERRVSIVPEKIDAFVIEKLCSR